MSGPPAGHTRAMSAAENPADTPATASTGTPGEPREDVSGPTRPLEEATARIEDSAQLDDLADRLGAVAESAVPPGAVREGLRGQWLGHPAHPLLTDLPIGFWTSAMVVDLVGGKAGRRTADRLVAAGILAAAPTAYSGLAEMTSLRGDAARRVAAVHAAGNVVGTLLFALSWVHRKRGRRLRGFLLSALGATALSGSGHLGGHLAYRRGAGVDATAPSELAAHSA